MKKIILVVLAGFTFSSNAQEPTVEKSLTSVQTGPFGIWLLHELKISKSILLRAEAGLDASNNGYIRNLSYHDRPLAISPVFTIEPRFYLNLKRRSILSKGTRYNSGSFIALSTTIHPDWFTIPSKHSEATTKSVFLTPMFGLRRNIGKHFNYEAAIGLGFGRLLETGYTFPNNYNGYSDYFILRTPLRIGYRF